ncbi:hypothetical protein SeMB42_g07207 [Synchytrium endobioticum]|uniref:Dynein regulatory complex subunit 2 n=1 Tax=Synchytrium endobioticum TaxID=286115 RepID=A0A507DCT9_9FUNG|nr:hypothetical protein SeMB42_g07207 [Synchytrium endobioticum]TPX49414.1 hypothetical protein SeLEV6574_g01503 [Synchytrium endobioticum]
MAKGAKSKKAGKGTKEDPEALRLKNDQLLEKLKQDIADEERAFKINTVNLQAKWRTIMKEAKSTELVHQLSILSATHQRYSDLKSAALANLQKDLLEAEEQYANAQSAHLNNVDALIDLQQDRLRHLQDQFNADVAYLESEFESERQEIGMRHLKSKTDILGIVNRMDIEFTDAEADAKHEFSSVKDDVKNKNLEEKHALRIQLEGTVEDLWRQFQSALNAYTSATEERKKQFEELKAKDLRNAKEIDYQMRKLAKLQESISSLKQKHSHILHTHESQLQGLRELRERISSQFQAMKLSMSISREREKRRLADLSVMSNQTIKLLRSRVDKAERIIKLAEMNNRMESDEERVWPFGKSTVPDVDEQAANGETVQEDSKSFAEGSKTDKNGGIHASIEELQLLSKFHYRYNRAALDRLALERSKARLLEENNQLRYVLKQYLDGISVSETTLKYENSLLVVNGRTNAPLKHIGGRTITVVEGGLAIRAQQLRC